MGGVGGVVAGGVFLWRGGGQGRQFERDFLWIRVEEGSFSRQSGISQCTMGGNLREGRSRELV